MSFHSWYVFMNIVHLDSNIISEYHCLEFVQIPNPRTWTVSDLIEPFEYVTVSALIFDHDREVSFKSQVRSSFTQTRITSHFTRSANRNRTKN